MQFHIDVPAFLASLPLMLWGMIGIFVVIFVIYGFIALFNKVFATAEKKE